MRRIAYPCAALILAALSGLASAQGDGGSQTSCELRNSTCKQTANADYQFCKNSSQGNCSKLRTRELRACSNANARCQAKAGGY